MGVVVRGFETGMAQPAADHRDIDACGNQMHRGRMAKHVIRFVPMVGAVCAARLT